MGFAWITCFAAAAFLTAQSFMKVTEPLLAISAVIGCFAIAVLVTGKQGLLPGAAGPCLAAFGAAVANAQFNSYLGLSDYLSWLAIFSPAWVALCALPWIARRPPADAKNWPAALATAIGAAIVVAAVVVWTQLAAGGGEEEW
jgi:hypothetical protein